MKKVFSIFHPVLMMSLAMILISIQVIGQPLFTIDPSSEMIITGTSSVHDWESEVTSIKGSGKMEILDASINRLEDVTVEIPVNSIKSGKGIMDGKTYDALLAEKHPNITFQLTSWEPVKENTLSATGRLTIAGVSRTVTIPVTYKSVSGMIEISGAHTIVLADFGIDPPTALMGTLKTGEEITVKFTSRFVTSEL